MHLRETEIGKCKIIFYISQNKRICFSNINVERNIKCNTPRKITEKFKRPNRCCLKVNE